MRLQRSEAVLREVQRLSSLLEKEIPANSHDPSNQKLSDKLEKILVRHFQKVEKGMPWSKLTAIYNKYAEE